MHAILNIWYEIDFHKTKYVIGVVYRHLGGKIDHFNDMFSNIVNYLHHRVVLVLRLLHLRYGWNDSSVETRARVAAVRKGWVGGAWKKTHICRPS